ncbi:MAG: threonylcarbamoyl-AMP synthase [Chitinophagaceae bacterium]|nr:threonylcarbamoyl-AMP synthase [Chitinophagaceae bacterium]
MEIMDEDIRQCLRVLSTGGIILYPTDTVWGIGCDATNSSAVERIFHLKQRRDDKAMIVLVSDEQTVLNYVNQPDPRIFEYLKKAKKPTTVVYDGAKQLAANLSSDGTIGIRICRDPFCQKLLQACGKPLVSTSANVSGHATPVTFHDIPKEIVDGVDYVVNYRRDDISPASPSSVVRWTKEHSIEVLRP